MLGRAHRFHGHKALNGVYKRGKTARSAALNLRYVQREPGRPYRVAIVVSRKVSKSAVVRNRIRRRVYAAVRSSDPDIRPGTDLVFTAFSDRLADLPHDDLRKMVTELLQKAI